MHPTRLPHPARLPRSAGAARLAAALVAGLAAALAITVVGPAPSAHAAAWEGTQWAHAYGRYVTYSDGETIWRGSEWIDGEQVYCLEPRWHSADAGDSVTLKTWTAGTFVAEGDSNSSITVSGAQAQAINWLVARKGQQADDQNALNVASAIRTYLHADDGNGDTPGTQLYEDALPYLHLLEDYAPPKTPASTQHVSLRLATDAADASLGTLTVVDTPLTAIPATITLTNGVFASNGATAVTLPSLSDGLSLPIRGVPPAVDGQPYTIRAALTGNGTVKTGAYPKTLRIATHDATHQQQLLPPSQQSYPVRLAGSAADTTPRPSGFTPVVSTVADSETVTAGAAFHDTVTIAAGAGPDGRTADWPRDPDGGYLPVLVECIVYGPFRTRPKEADAPPEDAPIASSFTVTTGPDGPDTSYEGVSDEPLEADGLYSTVCTIDAAHQPEIDPVSAGYLYADRFGRPPETVRVPKPPTPRAELAELAETGPPANPLPTILGATALGTAGLIAIAIAQVRRRRGGL